VEWDGVNRFNSAELSERLRGNEVGARMITPTASYLKCDTLCDAAVECANFLSGLLDSERSSDWRLRLSQSTHPTRKEVQGKVKESCKISGELEVTRMRGDKPASPIASACA